MLRRRHHEAVDADQFPVEARDPAGASSGTTSRHSSGRKPATRFTPPIVVLGSRSAAIASTSSTPLRPASRSRLEVGVRRGAERENATLRRRSSSLAQLPAVDHRDVDRRAAPAAHPHLLRHLHRVHRRRRARCRTRRRRSRRGRCRGRPGGRDPPGARSPPSRRHLALADLPHRDRRHRPPPVRAPRACR